MLDRKLGDDSGYRSPREQNSIAWEVKIDDKASSGSGGI